MSDRQPLNEIPSEHTITFEFEPVSYKDKMRQAFKYILLITTILIALIYLVTRKIEDTYIPLIIIGIIAYRLEATLRCNIERIELGNFVSIIYTKRGYTKVRISPVEKVIISKKNKWDKGSTPYLKIIFTDIHTTIKQYEGDSWSEKDMETISIAYKTMLIQKQGELDTFSKKLTRYLGD